MWKNISLCLLILVLIQLPLSSLNCPYFFTSLLRPVEIRSCHSVGVNDNADWKMAETMQIPNSSSPSRVKINRRDAIIEVPVLNVRRLRRKSKSRNSIQKNRKIKTRRSFVVRKDSPIKRPHRRRQRVFYKMSTNVISEVLPFRKSHSHIELPTWTPASFAWNRSEFAKNYIKWERSKTQLIRNPSGNHFNETPRDGANIFHKDNIEHQHRHSHSRSNTKFRRQKYVSESTSLSYPSDVISIERNDNKHILHKNCSHRNDFIFNQTIDYYHPKLNRKRKVRRNAEFPNSTAEIHLNVSLSNDEENLWDGSENTTKSYVVTTGDVRAARMTSETVGENQSNDLRPVPTNSQDINATFPSFPNNTDIKSRDSDHNNTNPFALHSYYPNGSKNTYATTDEEESTPDTEEVTSSTEPLQLPGYLRWGSTVLISAVLVVGVVGNLLVPAVVLRGKRSTPVYFMTNLAVSDLLVLVVCLPTALVELQTTPESWVLGPVLCKVRPFVEYAAVHGSALSLVVVSLERYVVVCRPLIASRRFTRKTCLSAVGGCWLIALTSAGPILWLQHETEARFVDGLVRKVCVADLGPVWPMVYYPAIAVLFFFLPLLLLAVLYGLIARRLLRDTSELGATGTNSHLRVRRQLVFTFSLVVFFFFFCLLPLRIFLLWILASPHENIIALGMQGYYNILYFCRVMFYLNSAINPILYNMTSTRFRTAFRDVFCGRTDRNSRFTPFELFTSFANRNERNSRTHLFSSFAQRSSRSSESGVPMNHGSIRENFPQNGVGRRHHALSHTTSLCLTPTPMRHSRKP